jgi:PAS domain S-box-containing protein
VVPANSLPVGVFRTDLGGRCLYISKRVTELIGLSAEDAMQFGWERTIHAEDREAVSRQLQSAMQARTPWQADFRCQLPDGTIRWILGQATPECDPHGHVVGYVGTLIDTTLSQQALRASEERDAFLLKLTDALRPISDPLDVQEVAARLVGEHLGVNRVGYAEIEDRAYIVRREYVRGVAPLGRGPSGTFGAALRDAYRRGETVVVNDVRTDPRFTDDERVNIEARQIAAFVGVTLVKGGRLVAAFGANHATPRLWTPLEIELIRDVAQRTWGAVDGARAEAALRQREQRLRLALDACAGGSWTWDAGTNRVDWDDGFRVRYGFAADELSTFEAWLSRVHEDDRPQVLGLLDEIQHSTTKAAWDNTFRIVRPDGAVLWIQSLGRADRDANGAVTRLTGLELDVTERRRVEEALQARRDEERDRELRLLLETAAQGIVSVDAQGLIVTANRAAEAMFGWASGELIGQSIERLVPASLRDLHAHHRSHYFAGPRPRPTPVDADLMGQRRDGTTFPIEVSLNHVANPSGGRAIAFVTDITARKRAEAALQERTAELEQRTAQLSQLASDLTLAEQDAREELAQTLHDGLQQLLVSASLNLARSFKRGARRGAESEALAQAKRHLDEAIEAARSLSLDLFPPLLHGSGLPAALVWLAQRTGQEYGIVVETSADPLADSSRKDVRTLLFESMRELLFNAVKHGQVDRITVDLALSGDDTLCITVADQGSGFDPSDLMDRAKAGRSGWGLFRIRERLTLLGGRVDIESAPGQGTTVRLMAPRGRRPPAESAAATDVASHHPATSAPAPHAASHPPGRALKILIVDDHAGVRDVIRVMLQERREFRVVGEAANGLEAIAKAHALKPDVVLMDVMMPEMDGVEATRRIRAELPFIQIIALTTIARADSLHAIERVGAAAFFTKGVETQRLIDQLMMFHTAVTLGSPASGSGETRSAHRPTTAPRPG